MSRLGSGIKAEILFAGISFCAVVCLLGPRVKDELPRFLFYSPLIFVDLYLSYFFVWAGVKTFVHN